MQSHVETLELLANGINPMTRQALPQDHLFNQPQVMRALFAAIMAMKNPLAAAPAPVAAVPTTGRKPRAPRAERPPRVTEMKMVVKQNYDADNKYHLVCPKFELKKMVDTKALGMTYLQRKGHLIAREGLPALLQAVALNRVEVTYEDMAAQADRPTIGAHTGKRWTEDEQKQLVAEFDQKVPMATIAQNLKRSETAIEAQLAKLGKIPKTDRFKKLQARTGMSPAVPQVVGMPVVPQIPQVVGVPQVIVPTLAPLVPLTQ